MTIPLEDLFGDVVGKAQRGLGLSTPEVAQRAQVSEAAVDAVKAGAPDPMTLQRIAPVLGLHAASLLAMAAGDWRPEPVTLDGLAQFNTPYHDMTVNAYLVWDAATKEAAVFDTGATAAPIAEKVRALGLRVRYLFLTHTHPDHVADIETVGAAEVFASEREPHEEAVPFKPGTAWQIGSLKIESRSTWGHSKGGTTFVIHGLARPVAIVGDALFASSMGGGMVSYADALITNRQEILSLPDETIICPGHGPMTTVAEEKAHNPFYPEYK
jgi:glyoxylase-like metal-dependent hydrolase (beta-lactamase superfamily II)